MEYFKQETLSTATHSPRIWLRYLQKEEHKQTFLEDINIVDLAIRFTVEDNKEDGAIPFLDTIVKSETDGRLSITVYR